MIDFLFGTMEQKEDSSTLHNSNQDTFLSSTSTERIDTTAIPSSSTLSSSTEYSEVDLEEYSLDSNWSDSQNDSASFLPDKGKMLKVFAFPSSILSFLFQLFESSLKGDVTSLTPRPLNLPSRSLRTTCPEGCLAGRWGS